MLLERLDEHMGSHADLQRGRELLEEVLQLIGLQLRRRRTLEELSDVVPKNFRQVDVLHSRVRIVDLRLHLLALRAHLGDQDGKFAENVGLENGTCQVDHDHEDEFFELLWAHFITTDDQDRIIEADPVTEHVFVILVPIPEGIRAVIVVVGWHPRLVTAIFERLLVGHLDHEEPHAADQVQVDDEEHVIVQHHHHDLAALVEIRLRDEGGDPQHTVHLQNADHV